MAQARAAAPAKPKASFWLRAGLPFARSWSMGFLSTSPRARTNSASAMTLRMMAIVMVIPKRSAFLLVGRWGRTRETLIGGRGRTHQAQNNAPSLAVHAGTAISSRVGRDRRGDGVVTRKPSREDANNARRKLSGKLLIRSNLGLGRTRRRGARPLQSSTASTAKPVKLEPQSSISGIVDSPRHSPQRPPVEARRATCPVVGRASPRSR